MQRPIIGITPDRDQEADRIESLFYLRRNYCSAVVAAGGLPLILPYHADLTSQYLPLLDGLIVTGGMFDLDPALYGMSASYPETMLLKPDRTSFEHAMLEAARAAGVPVLGICGGMQLIAVALGAQLIQHIPSQIDTAIEHKQAAPCDTATHGVRIAAGSRLRRILGVDRCRVNSLHHQSVVAGNASLAVAAQADDGVIEAVEALDGGFCIGVQWHPEYGANQSDRHLFNALVEAAAGFRRARA